MAADLQRFVNAQAPVFETALAELRAGAKRGHWMWFVFPQLRGLGRTETARFYGIAALDEARAYAAHPQLGARLRACAKALLDLPPAFDDPRAILGRPDDLKLRSSMTLFERAVPDEPVFAAVLERFHAGERDPLTLRLLDG